MKDLLIAWAIGLVMMLGGGFFAYLPLSEIIEHVKRYKEDKSEKTLPSWYLNWLFIIGDVALGSLGRPSLMISIISFLIGITIFVVYTIRIIASLFGYDLVF